MSPGIDSKESILSVQPVRQKGLSHRPARLGIDSWAPSKVYKFGIWEKKKRRI
jgi:hypothetical protein